MNFYRDPLNHPILTENGILSFHISNPTSCFYCKNEIAGQQEFCAVCGFPQKGNQQEMQQFVSTKRILRSKRETYRDRLREIKIRLFAVAGIFLLGGIVTLIMMKDSLLFTPVLIEVAIEVILFSGAAAISFANNQIALIVSSVLLGIYVMLIVYIYGAMLLIGFVGLASNLTRIVLVVMAWQSYIQAQRTKQELQHNNIVF